MGQKKSKKVIVDPPGSVPKDEKTVDSGEQAKLPPSDNLDKITPSEDNPTVIPTTDQARSIPLLIKTSESESKKKHKVKRGSKKVGLGLLSTGLCHKIKPPN